MTETDGEKRPIAVGLTGGIGCGKSEVGRMLAADGIPVLEADDVAHEVMRRGKDVYRDVVGYFGEGILDVGGEIDRSLLGPRVFADEDERRVLEGMVHPAVLEELQRWLENVTVGQGRPAVAVVPLLFEAGAEGRVDEILCVAASKDVVRERLLARGLTDTEIEQRIDAQMPIEEKARRAGYVIRNDASLEALRQETREVWNRMIGKEYKDHG